MASSSQLEVPVRKTTSVVYDSTWSLDSTPARQELPGKTLDFSFDVSADMAHQDVPELPQKNQSETTGWKRPQLSQVLVNFVYTSLIFISASKQFYEGRGLSRQNSKAVA